MAMMKATKRTELGTNAVRRLRKAGNIPGIIYGHKETPVAITICEHEFALSMSHHEHMLEVDVDGEKQNVLIKDVQYDTFGQEILHVDFSRVDLNERVTLTVPIALRGTAVGVSEGGILNLVAKTVSIECVVTAIPGDIRVDVSELNIGDSLTLGDIAMPEGITLTDDLESTLCTVNVIVEKEEPEEGEEGEGGAEPEVIGAKEEEEAAE